MGGDFNTFYRRQTFSLETANALVLTYVGGDFNTFYRRQTFSLETANALVLTYVVLECHTCRIQYVIHHIIFV